MTYNIWNKIKKRIILLFIITSLFLIILKKVYLYYLYWVIIFNLWYYLIIFYCILLPILMIFNSIMIVIPISVPPLGVNIEGGERVVNVDTTLSLVCLAWGSHPPAEITWWRAGKKIKSYSHHVSYTTNGLIT